MCSGWENLKQDHPLTSFFAADSYNRFGGDLLVVYGDVYWVINTAVNYAMLLVTAKTCGCPASRIRLVLAAAVGGVYALCVLYTGSVHFVTTLCAAFIMTWVAFGKNRYILRQYLVFVSFGAAFAGVLTALLRHGNLFAFWTSGFAPIVLLGTFLTAYLLFGLIFDRTGRGTEGETVVVTARLGDRAITFTALRDTGNSLTDPLSGRPVLVVDGKTAAPLFSHMGIDLSSGASQDAAELLERFRALGCNINFRLVPYSVVGIEHSLMLAFLPDVLEVEGKPNKTALIGLSPTEISDGGRHAALIGC